MADSLFDFELLESADVLVDFDADEALNAVAAAETAQLETDQDEMAILADYVVPPNKTPEDLARDLEAMVTGVNTLSLQATEGTAVVRSLGSSDYFLAYPTGISECSCCGDGGTSQRHGELYPVFFTTGNVLGASACICSGRPSWRDNVVQRKRFPNGQGGWSFLGPGHGWHWRRDVSTWTLPVLLGALGYEYTLRELYNIWCFMPLIVQTQVRGQKNVEKNNQRLKTYSTLKEETQNFLEACGLPLKPSTQAEWKLLYREMGAFMAASSFVTHTPPCIMELPPAAVRDSKQHMIERAICDERITLPLAALKDVDAVYAKLLPQLGAASMVEIKVAWRCTEEQWWVAKVTDPAKAAAIYRKLGYPDAAIVGMGLPHPDAPPTGASGYGGGSLG